MGKNKNTGKMAISSSRSMSFTELQKVYNFVQFNIIPKLGSLLSFDTIGSFGKKSKDESYGDLDLIINKEDIKFEHKLEDYQILGFLSSRLENLGYETKKLSGFNQVSIGVKIPDTEKDIAQVDFMISPNMEWSKFIYYSPNFQRNESNYKGVFRNALLMAIITETSKNIISKNSFNEIEEIETNVIRFPEGVWRVRKSFKGKTGIIKTGKLLKDFDKFITLDPNQVVSLAVGDKYNTNDINTFEKLWDLLNDDNYIHLSKKSDILKKFKINLESIGLSYPKEAIEIYPDVFK